MRADLYTDFAIVGSGAGGSVVAYHLAAHGERVIVLERGKWVAPEDMSDDELEMISTLYKEGGAQTNTEADMFLLQGSCVGGSTVLTNAVCFRMEERTRASFAEHGFELPRDELARSYARVESVLNVHPLEEHLYSPAAWKLIDGMRRIGIEPGRFDKAMLNCIGCGYCNVGCRYGRKLDASTTWMPMARDAGADVATEVEVVRIEARAGHARVLHCRDRRDDSPFRVHAKRIVLAGGAINTPELLLRSGIHRDRAGRRTSFNAGTVMFAEYREPVDGFLGDQMCVYHSEPNWTIEQIHNPPASFALTMPGWFDRHHGDLRRYRHLSAAGVLVPTQATGRVFLGLGHKVARKFFDHSDVRFSMPREDLANMRQGFKQLARIYFASGATRVVPPLAHYTEFRTPDDINQLDAHFRHQRELVGFGSSHPQGGAAAGDDPSRDVVGPDFRVHGFDNLFVADASVFPHSIKVNPMLSIMAVADHAVGHIAGITLPDEIEAGPAWRARATSEANVQ